MAQGSADQGTVGGHLGHARGEVVAMLVAVLGQPRGEELLGAGEGSGRQHLGAQRVRLELLDIGLRQEVAASPQLAKPNSNLSSLQCSSLFPIHPSSSNGAQRFQTYRQVALGAGHALSSGQCRANGLGDGVLSTGAGKRRRALKGPLDRAGAFSESGGALGSGAGDPVDGLLGHRLDGALDHGAMVVGGLLKGLRGRILDGPDRVPLKLDRHGARWFRGCIAMGGRSWS